MNFIKNVAGEVVDGTAEVLKSLTGHNSQQNREWNLDKLGPIKRPFVVIADGKRVNEDIKLFLDECDKLILSGDMIFAFYKAQGYKYEGYGFDYKNGFPSEVGLVSDEDVDLAKSILKEDEAKGKKIVLPTDVVVLEELTYYAEKKVVPVSAIPEGWIGVDIGPESIELFNNVLSSAKTLFWEGQSYEFGKFARARENKSELEDKGVNIVYSIKVDQPGEGTIEKKLWYDEPVATYKGDIDTKGKDIGMFHFGG